MCHLRELLSLINGGKYAEALLYFQSFHPDSHECLRELAIDAIFDAVTVFSDNNDDNLKALVVSLLDVIEPEPLKFRVCLNFITGRSTPHLNEILISQLRFMLMNNFKDKYPSEWQELCNSLPLKLEKISDECSADVCAALDVAHILHLFRDIPFVLPLKISNVFTAAVNSSEPELPGAFPLLLLHSKTHPFSPKLLGVEEPTILIPNVYSLYFRVRKLVEGLTIYLRENDYNYEEHFVKPIVTALDVIVQTSEGLDVSDIVLYSDLILRLLHFVEDFEQHSFRVLIMNRCLDILHKFSSCPKCLLIKYLISQVLSSSDLSLDNESSIIALFIDQFRKHLIEEPFQKELGSFFGMLEDVRYENMCEASNYYVSIFTLVQFVALQRSNLAMLAEVKTRILDRAYSQISDYIQLEEVREKEKRDRKTTTPRLPESAFDVAIKTPFEGSVTDQIQLLLFNHEQAKQYISAVLNSLS